MFTLTDNNYYDNFGNIKTTVTTNRTTTTTTTTTTTRLLYNKMSMEVILYEIWDTLQSKEAFNLIIYIIGITVCNVPNIVSTLIQVI